MNISYEFNAIRLGSMTGKAKERYNRLDDGKLINKVASRHQLLVHVTPRPAWKLASYQSQMHVSNPISRYRKGFRSDCRGHASIYSIKTIVAVSAVLILSGYRCNTMFADSFQRD